ncbi:hypothetical protein QJQ45_021255, partial [Haematococcus lacustris]
MLHFDLAATRSALLPLVVDCYKGLMAGLAAQMTTIIKDLLTRLARYIDRLRNRPSELPDFVAFMELCWAHLEPSSVKRQRVTDQQEHLRKLYTVLMAAVPKAEDEDKRKQAAGAAGAGGSGGEGVEEDGHVALALPEVVITVREARPVHMLWKQVQTEINRYHEEAAAAADFFTHSSALMTNHLKNGLLQMESDLLQLLHSLRLGHSTSVASKPGDVRCSLDAAAQQLAGLAQQLARSRAWTKLLASPKVTQVLANVDKLHAVAEAVVQSRCQLWQVLAQWDEVMDQWYSLPCTDKGAAADEVMPLEAGLRALGEQVAAITSLHVLDDVASTSTVTPQEAALGAHFALQVKAWRDMLPYAQRLTQEAVLPRHVCILLTWLKVAVALGAICLTPVADAHAADVQLGERYPLPFVHVSDVPVNITEQLVRSALPGAPDAGTAPAAAPTPAPGHKTVGAAVGSAVAPISAEEAGSVTMAQLLSRCTENAETRMLADKAVEVALAEQRLVAALAAVRQRLASASLTFAVQRTGGAFIITNAREVETVLAAAEAELEQVRASPLFGGIMAKFEEVEQLLAAVATSILATLRCQDTFLLLSALMHSPEVLPVVPELAPGWDTLSSAWRKLTFNVKEAALLVAVTQSLQDVDVIEEAMRQMVARVTQGMVGPMREAFPRLHWVSDQVLLESLAVAADPGALPPALLTACFHGLQRLLVVEVEGLAGGPEALAEPHRPSHSQHRLSTTTSGHGGEPPPNASLRPTHLTSAIHHPTASLLNDTGPDWQHATSSPDRMAGAADRSQGSALLTRPALLSIEAVVGSDGGVMSLQPPLLYQGPGAQPLAVMLAELEGCLRSSCKAHTRACHQACGVMQVGQQPLWTPRGPAPAPAILTHTMALLPPLLPPPLLLPPLLPPPLFPPPLLPVPPLSLPLLPSPLLSLPLQLPPMSQRTLLPLRLCLQADKWVASFPVMSIQLVDSVVWTQSVTAALTRASSGERAAMRNLLDQSVLRLETMARQLRAAQAASAEASQLAVASLAAVAAVESVGSGRSGVGQELVEAAREAQAAADAARNLCRGLQALITLGVGHRQ